MREETLPVQIPNYNVKSRIKNGFAEYESVNPATGNTETLKIDLSTGEYTKIIDEPDMIFSAIIPLN